MPGSPALFSSDSTAFALDWNKNTKDKDKDKDQDNKDDNSPFMLSENTTDNNDNESKIEPVTNLLVSAKIADKLDYTIENGQVAKFNITSTLVIAVKPVPTKDICFDVKIASLQESIALSFSSFAHLKTPNVDEIVQINYPANKEEVPVLTCSWKVIPLSICPVMIRILKDIQSSRALLHCKLKLNPKYAAFNISTLTVEAKCIPDDASLQTCIERVPSQNDDLCQFFWPNDDQSHAFMWKIYKFVGTRKENKLDQLDLKANFETTKPLTDFDVRCSFVIEDFAVSKMYLTEPQYKQSVTFQDFVHVRTVRSGDFVVR
ncbi:hypothetical protein RFI_09058 [Reticulomyxa filosa]|uniref:MHD domain-containing protein n=1 Tax=Reticulomyxa filosa TaxID=46433 RepID=X6NQ76_RETFI|nr:hypothetical protein RFI_09058 [Reticulomyxa filosa]|eukprot:ETO28073.1 hypothetical protein RFI_09058 [Reticulomyxa filosa]